MSPCLGLPISIANILKNGSYGVKANEIADKIVQKIRENKNHLIL